LFNWERDKLLTLGQQGADESDFEFRIIDSDTDRHNKGFINVRRHLRQERARKLTNSCYHKFEPPISGFAPTGMANRHRSRLNRKERTNKKITLLLPATIAGFIFCLASQSKQQTGKQLRMVLTLSPVPFVETFWQGCPHCGTSNSWAKCKKCGDIHCNSCGLVFRLCCYRSWSNAFCGATKFSKMKDGTKRSAGNCCPACKNTNCFDIIQSAPAWGK